MSATVWAVQLAADGGPIYYGPFRHDEHEAAQRFARFVTEEIDPAKVVPFTEVWPVGGWRSPLTEVLNWRDRMAETGPNHEAATDPSACRHCPETERGHFQRWTDPVGWHRWTAPTQEQIKARMTARRAGRQAEAAPGDWPHLYPPDDPRHLHDTDPAGNCKNPACGYLTDGTSADDERESRSQR
jgi:hypothetical protein